MEKKLENMMESLGPRKRGHREIIQGIGTLTPTTVHHQQELYIYIYIHI